jgi:hypothetical protein
MFNLMAIGKDRPARIQHIFSPLTYYCCVIGVLKTMRCLNWLVSLRACCDVDCGDLFHDGTVRLNESCLNSICTICKILASCQISESM